MAHRLLIGNGMITLNLKRIFLTLTLLPLFAVALMIAHSQIRR